MKAPVEKNKNILSIFFHFFYTFLGKTTLLIPPKLYIYYYLYIMINKKIKLQKNKIFDQSYQFAHG